LSEGTIGVATVILLGNSGGVEVFEESEGSVINIEVVASFPLGDSGIEEFGCRGGD